MSTKYTGFKSSASQTLVFEPGTSEVLRQDRFLMLSSLDKRRESSVASEMTATRKSVSSVDAAVVKPGDFRPPERA